MKAFFLYLILFAACNEMYGQACCCNSSGGNYSVLPNMDKHIIGLRYTYSSYNATTFSTTEMVMNGTEMVMVGPSKPTLETMQTLELFGRFNLPKRFLLSVFVPVHFLNEKSADGVSRLNGLGDLSLLLQYNVVDPKKCTGKKVKHQFRPGFGVKLPTGSFKMDSMGVFTNDLQMGSGSVDFLINVVYTLRYKKSGLNVISSYKKDLPNKEMFRFGDKLRFGTSCFYVANATKNLVLVPVAGVDYDHVFYNSLHKLALTYTGGDYISAKTGIDIYYKSIAFSATVSPMLMSLLNWEGEPLERLTFETGLYYIF